MKIHTVGEVTKKWMSKQCKRPKHMINFQIAVKIFSVFLDTFKKKKNSSMNPQATKGMDLQMKRVHKAQKSKYSDWNGGKKIGKIFLKGC